MLTLQNVNFCKKVFVSQTVSCGITILCNIRQVAVHDWYCLYCQRVWQSPENNPMFMWKFWHICCCVFSNVQMYWYICDCDLLQLHLHLSNSFAVRWAGCKLRNPYLTAIHQTGCQDAKWFWWLSSKVVLSTFTLLSITNLTTSPFEFSNHMQNLCWNSVWDLDRAWLGTYWRNLQRLPVVVTQAKVKPGTQVLPCLSCTSCLQWHRNAEWLSDIAVQAQIWLHSGFADTSKKPFSEGTVANKVLAYQEDTRLQARPHRHVHHMLS